MALDHFEVALKDAGITPDSPARVILRPYLELPEVPERFRPLLALVDEVWAPTTFVAQAFERIFDGNVRLIRPVVRCQEERSLVRRLLSYRRPRRDTRSVAAPFLFLFSFDYNSSPARKNPIGVAEAFRRAFPDGRENVRVILKSVGPAASFPRTRGILREMAAGDGRIVIVEDHLDPEALSALYQEADCYVSLHRGEGFGLGIAEMMALGKPVAATDFGGSTDLIRPQTAFPIKFTRRALRDGEYYDGDGQSWAEPDLDDAAAAMRIIWRGGPEVVARARAGQRLIQERHNKRKVGSAIRVALRTARAGL